MKLLHFELFLRSPEDPSSLHADEFLDRVEEDIFDAFGGRVTPGMCGGVPVLICSVEAESIDSALEDVIGTVLKLGLYPTQANLRVGDHGYAVA